MRKPWYVHAVALAHTDFDPEKAEDWALERSLPVRRPAHAPASAYYGRLFVVTMLDSVPATRRAFVASACLVRSWRTMVDGGGRSWSATWGRSGAIGPLRSKLVLGPVVGGEHFEALRRRPLENLLRVATGPDHLEEWWPIVAYFTRPADRGWRRRRRSGSRPGAADRLETNGRARFRMATSRREPAADGTAPRRSIGLPTSRRASPRVSSPPTIAIALKRSSCTALTSCS